MGDLSPETIKLIVIISTVLGALVVSSILTAVSQRSRQSGRHAAEAPARSKPSAPKAVIANGAFLPAILREMESLSVPLAQRQQVATVLSDLLAKQVEATVSSATQEVAHKYEQVVQEKDAQYHVTLTQKQQIDTVMRSMAEGLVVVNPKGEVMFLNPAAEKLLGVNQQDKMGKRLTDGMTDEQLLSLIKNPDNQEELEVELSAKQDQTKRVLRSSNAVIEDENGRTIGMVSILSDVTKQRELEQLKTDFVSNVTHELRTPIVAIQHSLAVMLQDAASAGQLSEPQKHFLTIAQRNIERLNGMVNNLLDLAKFEAKRMELQREQASIVPVIRQTCQTLQAWAGSKAIRLEPRLQEGLPEISYDPMRLEQVLHNLVGNAIKFTPKDGTVTIEAARHEDALLIRVSVSDTGPGIAAKDLPKLFSKFQQVGERRAGDLQGTGLGLAITKEIVELHGGKIWAESEQGTGARFVFTLPITPPMTTT